MMKLYKNDIARMWKCVDNHEKKTEEQSGCEYFSLVVKDIKGNPIGTVENDEYGHSCFTFIGDKKR